MNIRLLSVSAVAAISLTCAKTAAAGTSVQVSYVAPAVVYAPPPRPVYYYAPPPRPIVVVSPYMVPPSIRITYAQPVLATPVVVMH